MTRRSLFLGFLLCIIPVVSAMEVESAKKFETVSDVLDEVHEEDHPEVGKKFVTVSGVIKTLMELHQGKNFYKYENKQDNVTLPKRNVPSSPFDALPPEIGEKIFIYIFAQKSDLRGLICELVKAREVFPFLNDLKGFRRVLHSSSIKWDDVFGRKDTTWSDSSILCCGVIAGKDLRVRGYIEGNNPLVLHELCKRKWNKALDVLLEAGVEDIDRQDKFGDTPLLAACWSGSRECCSILIQAGANINHINTSGISPVRALQLREHLDCMDLFAQEELSIDREITEMLVD